MSNVSEASEELVIKEFSANHTQSEGNAVGGKVTLTTESLLFTPNLVNKLLGGEECEIVLDNIESVGVEKKGSGSMKDTLKGGGLRDRLRIKLDDGTQELFVVSNLDEIVEELNRVVNVCGNGENVHCVSCGAKLTPDTQFCPDCGTENTATNPEILTEVGDTTADSGNWLTLGIAYFFGGSGLVLGTIYLLLGPPPAGLFLLIAGIVGFPLSPVAAKLSRWVSTVLFLVFWLLGSVMLGIF